MLEILIGTTAPTLETVGEQGQLYIHQYQIGRRKFYGDLYICDIVHKYVNGPQDRDTIHYYWEKITPNKELLSKIESVEDTLLNKINYEDLNENEFSVDENNNISFNMIPEEKVENLTDNLNDIYDTAVFSNNLFKSEFTVIKSPKTNRVISVKINKINKEKIDGLTEIEEDLSALNKKVNSDIRLVPIENTLENNVEYRLFHMGKIGRLDFKLPENIPNEFKGKIFVRSSDNGIQLNIDNVIFMGEDCKDGKLNSVSSKFYEIIYENVGINDEQYAPNEWIVVAKVTILPINN